MPSIITCQILSARNLLKLVNDSLVDMKVYCELSFNDEKMRTSSFPSDKDDDPADVNIDQMEFEKIDDELLQLYPLVVTVYEADTDAMVGVV